MWRQLLRRRAYLRLLAVRLFGQFADGVFQASLAGTILFNPEHAAKAGDIAAGFAVLLLPYSMLGPFAGVLLDRWSRQRVLFGANLIRAVMVVGVAAEIASGVHGAPFYLSALLVISVNRFVLSALSAAQPHVVRPDQLITANAIAVTAGAVATASAAAWPSACATCSATPTPATRPSRWAQRCVTPWAACAPPCSAGPRWARTTTPATTASRSATCWSDWWTALGTSTHILRCCGRSS